MDRETIELELRELARRQGIMKWSDRACAPLRLRLMWHKYGEEDLTDFVNRQDVMDVMLAAGVGGDDEQH